jgi:dTDP-4-dehydrorhamnose 3,5-epimerase-like enzyme
VEVKRYHIEGLLSFVPRIFSDERGAFMETFNEKQFAEFAGKNIHFVQDNQSISLYQMLFVVCTFRHHRLHKENWYAY